jgi:hypothetical protein
MVLGGARDAHAAAGQGDPNSTVKTLGFCAWQLLTEGKSVRAAFHARVHTTFVTAETLPPGFQDCTGEPGSDLAIICPDRPHDLRAILPIRLTPYQRSCVAATCDPGASVTQEPVHTKAEKTRFLGFSARPSKYAEKTPEAIHHRARKANVHALDGLGVQDAVQIALSRITPVHAGNDVAFRSQMS